MRLVAMLLAASLASYTWAASVDVDSSKQKANGDEHEISAEEKQFGAKRKTSTNNDLKAG
jgi:hypothetical protein